MDEDNLLNKTMTDIEEELNRQESGSGEEQPAPKEKKPKQSEIIVELVKDHGDKVTLFHTELREPYAAIEINGHQEIWSCEDEFFVYWLTKLYLDATGGIPSRNAIKDAQHVLKSLAYLNGKCMSLSNRVEWSRDSLWYDLTDENWRAVQVTKDGWSVIDRPPILFKRFSHQRPQVEPERDGDIKLLLPYLNLSDESYKLLALVWVVAAFIPGYPHPAPIVHGAQGSAKTQFCKFFKALVDPSSLDIIAGFPKDEEAWAQQLNHHWCLFYDNITKIPDRDSDTLCKAVTGGGVSKRKFYTDQGDIILNFRRCVGLNGINVIPRRGDLMERSIIFQLERITEEARWKESSIWPEFQKVEPKILGGIFNVLAKAIEIKPRLKLTKLPRMADFADWGYAISEAMGYTGDEFLKIYNRNLNSQNEDVLANSLVAGVVNSYMETLVDPVWEDTPATILATLKKHADKMNINTDKEQEWPKAANSLTRELNLLKTNFSSSGLRVDTGIKKHKQRYIRLEKITVSTVEPAPPDVARNVNTADKRTISQSEIRFEPSAEKPLKQAAEAPGDEVDGILTDSDQALLEKVRQVFPGAEIVKNDTKNNE